MKYLLLLAVAFSPILLPAQHVVSGDIALPTGLPICDVLVQLTTENGQVLAQDMTEADGTFSLANIPTGENYRLRFAKEDLALNGVSTFDLIFLARHILGILPYNIYNRWIADVNGSNTVTTLDMIFIRKMILGIEDEFLVSTWAFDAPGTLLPDNAIDISTLGADLSIEVIGVKRGDMNNSAALNCN